LTPIIRCIRQLVGIVGLDRPPGGMAVATFVGSVGLGVGINQGGRNEDGIFLRAFDVIVMCLQWHLSNPEYGRKTN
jgi:hypothetical protein